VTRTPLREVLALGAASGLQFEILRIAWMTLVKEGFHLLHHSQNCPRDCPRGVDARAVLAYHIRRDPALATLSPEQVQAVEGILSRALRVVDASQDTPQNQKESNRANWLT